MPLRPCLVCGQLTDHGSYCRRHGSPSNLAWSRPGGARLRAQVLQRDGFACVVCGAIEGLAVHHRIPAAAGGPNTLENLETRCRRHHGEAHRT